ncbi:phosphoglycerate mutase-like protein 1 isoform X2 [Hordeum vulgare subsp. vulgare]|uniref:phosphoglycerate mutase-like protein 1 isoform X2 n=1 Tax=Hordeum vulgare subsp. vulgare TaxID=112509 RepID=UPI001D1A55AB|nr:phosphoglycerate mutase-like protein 1 isoform X2 [Hordeum vulgare subsp. vulgare]
MEASARTAMYPQHSCKNIYLVRHAQGIHNVEGEKDHSAYMSPALLDAHITPLGWRQVDCLREHVTKCGLDKKIELVIVSPLLRTMQTAVGVFGGGSHTNEVIASPLLMVEGVGQSGHAAISSLNCPPFLAVEACRERLIENDEDVLWEPEVRETIESVAARGMKFIDWLWTREEKDIAIVTHSSFLDFTLNMYGKECHPTIVEDMAKRFANCELRSMVLVDRSKLGSETHTCNFSGKIPATFDLATNVVDKK